MNATIDMRFVNLLSCRLEKFVSKKPGLYNFRCPYCGDSAKHKNKTRGYIFTMKNDLVFKCHNCGVGRSFGGFLKDNAPDMYDDYIVERYKKGLTGMAKVGAAWFAASNRKLVDPMFTKTSPPFAEKTLDLQKIVDLNISHPAKQYLDDRKISQEAQGRLYYVDRFQTWVNTQKETFPNTKRDHGRIIIPLISPDGSWFGFQGRSLNPVDKMRYITIMLDESKPKIFGMDRVNKDEIAYITEGAFDSFFIKNSIAMCGADADPVLWGIRDCVYVYDNEPRNREIVSRISRAIDLGQKVVVWPSTIEEKDINSMILSGHDAQSIVESNVYSGLEATVKLSFWKKV